MEHKIRKKGALSSSALSSSFRVRMGLSAGLTLAIVSVLTGSFGSFLVWKTMDAENRAYVQQSIGDTSGILASHFTTQLNHWITDMLGVGETQIRHAIQAGSTGQLSSFGAIDTNPDISDIALWKKSDVSSSLGEPKVVFTGINFHFKKYSENYVKQLKASGINESLSIQSAFQGKAVMILTSLIPGASGLATLAIPFGAGASGFVLVSHVHLERFALAFHRSGMVSAALVDQTGSILAHPDPKFIGKREIFKNNPLFKYMHSSPLSTGQITFTDAQGMEYYGGFSRVSVGQITVLASLSEDEALAAIRLMRKNAMIYISLSFILFFGIGYILSSRASASLIKEARNDEQFNQESQAVLKKQAPKVVVSTVLYGSLKQVSHLLESTSPEDATEAINQFLTVASSVVKSFGGMFERHSNTTFIGIWGIPEMEGTEIWRALRCSLELRQGLAELNEARKVDGLKPLFMTMGVHTGRGLAARMGAIASLKYSVVGDVLNCAQSLNRLTRQAGVDLLVSQDTWSQSESKFEGEAKGESKLSQNTGLTSYYTLTGYRNEQGQLVPVELPKQLIEVHKENALANGPTEDTVNLAVSSEMNFSRWLVNNGSQMIGPLTPKEISARLFAQELDFDSECWAEGTGNSGQIKSAKIFSSSDETPGNIWLYDGEMVHGPMTLGFLKTAIGHGAIKSTVHICEESTVNGWKLLTDWDDRLFVEKNRDATKDLPPEAEVSAEDSIDVLRASLAPPAKPALAVPTMATLAPPVVPPLPKMVVPPPFKGAFQSVEVPNVTEFQFPNLEVVAPQKKAA